MRYFEKVVSLEFDEKMCNGCGMCVTVCPHAVFGLENKRAILADRGACMECGACASNCEQGAIRVRTGTGCAAAVLSGMLSGSESACGCSGNKPKCPFDGAP